ncbi:MAG TPA: hypothetical protein VMY76_17530 [Gemmatimonadales bacterium]|nr:hypothetical protein [Gemmatimonadales bacterium]
MRRRMGVVAVLAGLSARPLAAQLHGQHWTVTPQTDSATVGDTVLVGFRLRLDERDLLFDTIPRPAATQPDWIRILSVEKLQRQPDRIFVGLARIAFYRPGRQQVPIFQLPFMRSVKGLSRGTVSSDTATVEVVPVLQAGGSATLRDIKEPARAPAPDPLELLMGLVALGAAGWLAWRARQRASLPALAIAPREDAVPPPELDPYGIALARLETIERERWVARDITRHYERVADALRDYLEAHGVPARERTTSELRWALPPELLAGHSRRGFDEVFGDADLVKFAQWRPAAAEGESFLRAARVLLDGWRAVEEADAPLAKGWTR